MNIRNIDFKKAGLIILFIVAIIIFALLLYIFFFKPSATPIPKQPTENINADGKLILSDEDLVISNQNTNTTVGLTPIGNTNQSAGISPFARGGPTHVSTMLENSSTGMTLAQNGMDIMFHNSVDNKFYKITPDGKTNLMYDKRFYNVDNVEFNSAKNKAIVEYPDGANISFNFTSGEQSTLPAHWEDFEFSKQAEILAFKNMGRNPENNWLVLSQANGTGAKFIEHLDTNADNVDINWSPDNRVVATYTDIYSEYGSGTQQELILLGKNDENFKSFIVQGIMFEGQWSKTGDRLLYSVNSEKSDWMPEIWMVNAQGNAAGTGRRNLNVKTWSHKCTFATNTEVYCAVPTEMKEGYALVPEVAKDVPDEIYKINLNTGTKTLTAQPDVNFNVSKIQISDDGKYLYFIDLNSGKLYKINL